MKRYKIEPRHHAMTSMFSPDYGPWEDENGEWVKFEDVEMEDQKKGTENILAKTIALLLIELESETSFLISEASRFFKEVGREDLAIALRKEWEAVSKKARRAIGFEELKGEG